MSRATPQMRDFAERLIACETRGNKTSEPKIPAAFLICERLRPQLATLMGKAGFRALLSRALAVAQAEIPRLGVVQVTADGSLEALEEPEAQADHEEMAEGCLLMVAQLLGLLVAFIGENLTVRLVRETWPKLSLNDLDFGKGN